ncbi:MAG TPA: hypothetical protein DIC19_03065 [Erysipelotrichaceae bacterium]|nr:hypothetical protein [Erysipelotrichaceae bacterium]
MRKHKKLVLNLILLGLLLVFLAGINGIRLSAKSAALNAGRSQYFNQAVASILAYEKDYAVVMVKQKEDASCYVVKKEMGLLWKASGYGTYPTNITKTEDKDQLKQECLYWLSLATNTFSYDVLTPIQYMYTYALNINGRDYSLYEITEKEMHEYYRILNDFFASTDPFIEYFKNGMNILWALDAKGQTGIQLLDPRQANTSVYFGEEGFNIYFTSQVNPNRNMTIQDVYLESQFILNEFMKTIETYETIDVLDVQGIHLWQSIIEDIIDEHELILEFGSITVEAIPLVSDSNILVPRDIEEFAKQEGWELIHTELTVDELTKMTKNDMFRLLNIPNRNVLIQAQDDQYLRFLKSDKLPLITETIDDTSVFISFEFNAENELMRIVETQNYQNRFTEIILNTYSVIQSYEDMLSYQERLMDKIAEEFDLDTSIIDVALVSQFPYQ